MLPLVVSPQTSFAYFYSCSFDESAYFGEEPGYANLPISFQIDEEAGTTISISPLGARYGNVVSGVERAADPFFISVVEASGSGGLIATTIPFGGGESIQTWQGANMDLKPRQYFGSCLRVQP